MIWNGADTKAFDLTFSSKGAKLNSSNKTHTYKTNLHLFVYTGIGATYIYNNNSKK